METVKIITITANTEVNDKNLFMTVFKDFNSQDAIENKHSEGTIYKYQNFTDNFGKFLIETNQTGLLVSEVKISILKDFVQWLKANLKSCNRTHLAKHVRRINRALDYAVNLELIDFNPCLSYKLKRVPNKAVISLNDKEFNKWLTSEWQSEIYQKAKDLYSFQMLTGLSYGDLFLYKTVNDPKTGIWIEGTRKKTKMPFFIPLWHDDFKQALAIHNRYNGKLPFIENHFYNRLIREMATILGIDTYLTTHIGRKTFATMASDQGRSVPYISTILGNTEKVCQTHYIKVSKNKIIHELSQSA